jgi:hypothetical protein
MPEPGIPTGEHATGRAGTVKVTGYKLVVPDGWFSVELEAGRLERAVARLVDRQFAGIDNAPHLKAQARQELVARGEAARKSGGVEMFLSLMQVGGLALRRRCQQGTGVRQHDRVVIHIHDSRFRRYALGHLVGVIRRRDAGTDIEELPDPRLSRQETHRPAEECPIRADPNGRQAGIGLQDFIADFTVGGEIVLPAKQVVIYPGLVRDAGVDVRRLAGVVGNRAGEEAT